MAIRPHAWLFDRVYCVDSTVSKMASSKRKLDFDVSEVKEEISCGASVHGVVVGMSPIKISRNNKEVKYIEGELSDGKEVRRFVSFDAAKFKDEVEKLMDKGESVSLTNCSVKKSINGDSYELVMSKRSSVVSSPKRFRIEEDMILRKKSMTDFDKLECVDDVAVNTGIRVGIRGKMVTVKKEDEVKTKDGVIYKKQECVVSDGRKAYRLVVWQDLVDKVESGVSYYIKNVTVKSYQGQKYFSTTDETELVEIADIGEVCDKVDDGKVKFVGEIVGIVSFTQFLGCVVCGSKVNEVNKVIGKCSKCELKQKMDRCKSNKAARVMVEDRSGKKKTISMFSDMIDLLIDDVDDCDGDVELQLLSSDAKEFEINSKNILISFTNPPSL